MNLKDKEIDGKGVCIIPKIFYIVPTTRINYLIIAMISFFICLLSAIITINSLDSIWEKIELVILIFTAQFIIVYHSIEYIITKKSTAILDQTGDIYKGYSAFYYFILWILPLVAWFYGIYIWYK